MQKVTVISVVVEKIKFLFGMRDCTVESDFGVVDFSLMLDILHVCGCAYV